MLMLAINGIEGLDIETTELERGGNQLYLWHHEVDRG